MKGVTNTEKVVKEKTRMKPWMDRWSRKGEDDNPGDQERQATMR